MMTLDNFESYVPYKIWQRGEEYYESGAVTELEKLSDGEWSATVEGTDEYEVEISVEDGIVTSWYCDCPYEGEVCKHVVATMLTIRSQHKKASRSAFSTRIRKTERMEEAVIIEETPDSSSYNDELKSLLSLIKPGELSQFIVEYASKSAEFSSFLKQRIQDKTLSVTEKDFQSQVCKVFNSYIGSSKSRYHRYDEPEHDWETILNKVDSFLDKAGKLAKCGNLDGAIAIALQVLRSIGEEYDDDLLYNDDVDVSISCEEAGDLIIDIAKNYSLSQKQKDNLLQELWRIAEISIYRNYDIYDVDELVQDITMLTQPVDKALELIDKLLVERKESWGLFEIVLRKVDLLQRMGEQQKADETITQYLYLPEIREKEVERLMRDGQYTQTISLLDEGIRVAEKQEHGGTIHTWKEKKMEVYEKMNNKTAVIDICRQLFISTNGDLQYYKKLKGLIPATKWKEFLKSMMQDTKFYDSFSFSGSKKADIYVCEKDNDSLFHLLESAGRDQLTALMQYASHLRETHSGQLLVMFYTQLKEYAAANLGRNHYEYIAKVLKIMQKLQGGDKAVRQLVAEFRIIYKRRSAMMQELSKF